MNRTRQHIQYWADRLVRADFHPAARLAYGVVLGTPLAMRIRSSMEPPPSFMALAPIVSTGMTMVFPVGTLAFVTAVQIASHHGVL